MNYIIFDLEWNQPVSGSKSPKLCHGEIIQIGFIVLDSELEILHREELTIKPVVYKIMNAYVSTLTGISQADVDAGLPFPEAFSRFSRFFSEDTALITWGDDDMPVLRENLAYHSIDSGSLPVHYNLQRIYAVQTSSHLRQTGLKTAADALGITDEIKAHDALNDAYLTCLIARELDVPLGISQYTRFSEQTAAKRPPWEENRPVFTAKSAFDKNPSGMAAECRKLHYCCTKCGKDFSGTEPVRQGKCSFVGIGECHCSGALFFRYSLKDGYIRVAAFRMTDELDEIYKSRIISREKREKRREMFLGAAKARRKQKKGVKPEND